MIYIYLLLDWHYKKAGYDDNLLQFVSQRYYLCRYQCCVITLHRPG